MKITVDEVQMPEDKKSNKKGFGGFKGKGPTKGKTKGKREKSKNPAGRHGEVAVPTDREKRLADLGLMRHHNFLSATTPMLNKIFKMKHVDDPKRHNKYQVEDEPHHVSAILKLTLATMSTNDMGFDWTIALWNITQQDDILPDDCSVTFTRVMERKDNALMKKKMKRRGILAKLSSDSQDNLKRQSAAVNHDFELNDAIDRGDSVVAFGGEAIVTAPNEQRLEYAVEVIKNYFRSNDETRGLRYELDINKQARPFVLYGANDNSGNREVYMDMTSPDAATSGLFVDSGGDRTLGAEYVGVSVGKLIRSHAAYNFQNSRSLYVGNDTVNKTTTLGGDIDMPTQTYLSQVASRAYMLSGHNVTHFVIDDENSASTLMDFPIDDKRKVAADVSKGLLNILEAVDNGEIKAHPERIISRFSSHVNNIITLLNQFRDIDRMTVNDDFANVARDILVSFFVDNKYWDYDAQNNLQNLRLIDVYHEQYKQLSDFGQYVYQRRKSNTEPEMKPALDELNTIVNTNILSTIPALNKKTSPIIDDLVKAQYRVVDFTGMNVGNTSTAANPQLNTMMISYLNLILPNMKNGDVLMFHGFSVVSSIAQVIMDMIANAGLNIDLVFTEKNQNAATRLLSATADKIEVEDETTKSTIVKKKQMHFDFAAVDLYKNRIDKLVEPLGIDKDWAASLSLSPETYFVKTDTGLDYIHLDRIL